MRRAQREKISRGLKRYYRERRRQQLAEHARRSRAAKLGWQRKKMRAAAARLGRVERKAKVPPKRPPKVVPAVSVVDEWEVTVKYEAKGNVTDVTVRVLAPRHLPGGRLVRREDVIGAVWRAALGRELTVMDVRGVDWHHNGKDYEYGVEDLHTPGFKSLLRSAVLRAEVVA